MSTFRALVIALLTLLVAAPAAAAQSSGLVAAYGFEEPSGTSAVDSSGSGNTGTLAGATRSTAGRFGNALSYDGVNDMVTVPDAASLDLSTGMTLEAWVRPEADNWRTALLKERAGGLAYALYASTDTNRPSAEIQADTRGPAALPTATWSHLAATYDGATLRLYVNGTQVSSRAVSGAIPNSTGALRIGGNAIWGEYFKGLIDEVRVYNRALTAGELTLDMGRAIVDGEAPTAPVLSGTVRGDDVHLSWTASTDNVGVKEYHVRRDGFLIATLGAGTLVYDDLDRPEGTHRYTVRAIDEAGNSRGSNEVALTVEAVGPDTTPPRVSVSAVGAPATENFCSGRPVDDYVPLRVDWSDDRGPVTMHIEVDGETVKGPITREFGDVTHWDFETAYIPNGPHTTKVIARDGAGNETVRECTWNVQNPDYQVPITMPNDGDTVSGVVTIKAAPTANGNPISYPVTLTGAPGATMTATHTWSWDTTGLDNGEYMLTTNLMVPSYYPPFPPRATDTIRVIVNNVVPAPQNLTAEVRAGNDVELRWDAVDGIDNYDVYRNGTKIRTTAATNMTDLDLAVGTHRYTVKAVRNGRESAASNEAEAAVAPDTTPPTVGLASNCDGATVADYLTLRPTFSDDRGPVTFTIKLDGETIRGPFEMGASGSHMFDWETRGLTNGTHVMTAVARDGAGNESVATCNWNVHNPVVTIPITSHQNGDTISGTVKFTADVLGDGEPLNRGLLRVHWSLTPVGGGTGTSGWDDTRPFEFSFGTGMAPDGLYNLKVTATWLDYAGPLASNTIQVRIHNAPPAPTGVRTEVRGDDVDVLWDQIPGVNTYHVYRDGTRIGTTSGTAFTDENRPGGTYRYTVSGQRFNAEGPRSDEVTATVVAAPAPTGLVAAYGFEETSGTTVADSSGKGNAGTIAGATSVAGGKFGRALSFDGSDDMVTVADSSALDLQPGMTLSAWVRPTTVSDWRTVLLKERPGQLAYALYAATDNGLPMAEIALSGNRDARGTTALPVGVWSHLAATYDGANVRLFMNGTQVASAAATGTLVNSAGALRIGGNAVWGEYFSGLIDEVRVYERALSAAEIAADRDRAVVPGT